ncbi:MAG: hypothetical protein QM831_20360 [Kofleriaceae bacterium]
MKALGFFIALAACGNEAIDIQVIAPGQPSFSGKIGDRPWQRFSGVSDGNNTTYQIAIDDDFELLIGCDVATGWSATELFGTYDDAVISIGSWQLPTCNTPTPSPIIGSVSVTGNMTDSGIVAIGDQTQIVTGQTSTFDIGVIPGTRDIAFTAQFIVGIRHDVELERAQNIGTISFALETQPMLTNDYEPVLVANEGLDSWLQLVTRNGTRLTWPNGDLTSAVFMPPDVMSYGDVQEFHVVTSYATGSRSAVATNFDRVAPSFQFLSVVQPFAWFPDTYTVRWQPISDFYTTASARFYETDGSGDATVTASATWLQRHGDNLISLDTTAPGFVWPIDAHVLPQVSAESWSSQITLTSTTNSAVAP